MKKTEIEAWNEALKQGIYKANLKNKNNGIKKQHTNILRSKEQRSIKKPKRKCDPSTWTFKRIYVSRHYAYHRNDTRE